jgi:hypothetical protein
MRGSAASFIGIFASASFILGTDAAAITFDDGLVHVIDAGNNYPFEGVIVKDGPGPSSTTVILAEGGEVGGTLQILDTSFANVTGGTVDSDMTIEGQSSAIVSSGTVGGNVTTTPSGLTQTPNLGPGLV